MILNAKTKAYRKANLVHPVQKYILIAVFFKHSEVFKQHRSWEGGITTPARVLSQELIHKSLYISTMQGTSYSFPLYDALEV